MLPTDREAWYYSYQDDPYRYCVYCCADCKVDEPDHSSRCPSVTGVYPLDRQLKEFGTVCPSCHEPITDYYMKRKMCVPDLMGGNADAFEVYCLGCAAQEALA